MTLSRRLALICLLIAAGLLSFQYLSRPQLSPAPLSDAAPGKLAFHDPSLSASGGFFGDGRAESLA